MLFAAASDFTAIPRWSMVNMVRFNPALIRRLSSRAPSEPRSRGESKSKDLHFLRQETQIPRGPKGPWERQRVKVSVNYDQRFPASRQFLPPACTDRVYARPPPQRSGRRCRLPVGAELYLAARRATFPPAAPASYESCAGGPGFPAADKVHILQSRLPDLRPPRLRWPRFSRSVESSGRCEPPAIAERESHAPPARRLRGHFC